MTVVSNTARERLVTLLTFDQSDEPDQQKDTAKDKDNDKDKGNEKDIWRTPSKSDLGDL